MSLPLSVRDLVVTDPKGRPVLEAPRLDVAPGEALVIRGPSGAGKSTLLFALAGLIAPALGAIKWAGTDLAKLGDVALTGFRRDHLGMIFQDHLLFEELGALANAGLAAAYAPRKDRPEIRRSAVELLRRLEIETDARRATTYSGGERQRIAVARALASQPDVLLADEPTASLDRDAADRLVEDLFAFGKAGGTLIIVSHDPAIHARAGRLASVIDGKLRTATHA